VTFKKQNLKPTQIWTSALHHISVFLETFKTRLSWRLSSGSVMIAHVKFSGYQVMEFSALTDETAVCSMRGRGDVGSTCCPGGVRCGSTYSSPQPASRGADSSLRFAPTELPWDPTLVILAGWRTIFAGSPGAAVLLAITGPVGCPAQGSCRKWHPVPS